MASSRYKVKTKFQANHRGDKARRQTARQQSADLARSQAQDVRNERVMQAMMRPLRHLFGPLS